MESTYQYYNTKMITEEEALNYEIFSTSLIGSYWRRFFVKQHIKACKKKYQRYITSMKTLRRLKLEELNQQP